MAQLSSPAILVTICVSSGVLAGSAPEEPKNIGTDIDTPNPVPPSQGDSVCFKRISSGYVLVEQDSRLHRFDAGSMFALDPAEAFIESVPEQWSIIALRIPKHLQRLFRSQGTSVMRHIVQVRLEHAHTLLRTGASDATSVQGIAWQCGFSTAAHFSRVFKQRFGVSPRSVMLAPAA